MSEVEAQSIGYAPSQKDPEPKLPAWGEYAILAVILLANIALKLPNLGHASLKPMDESFHAVVARNLLYDPFKPTLIREPYLPYDPTDWLSNHVWLHKPVLPLWIIAISFKVFGVSAFALRLPSLIFCTGAIVWTFLIARKLYGPIPALIASAMQAIVPTIGMIVHGYVFSDAIDINLLFWSELSLVLMVYATSRRWIVLSGAAAGAAFMSKTFPALFTLAPLMWMAMLRSNALLTRTRISTPSPGTPGEGRGEGSAGLPEVLPVSERTLTPTLSHEYMGEGAGKVIRTVFLWIVAFTVIAAPWNIYCAIRFPTEFKAEYGLILTHLSADVENWASPWDRLWFQHLPSALYHFWTICLVGSIVLTIRAIQLRKWEWLFVPIWIASVLIPFTLATSKTPSATLIAWPALMIGGGFLISRAAHGYIVELSTTIALLVAMIFFRGSLITKGWGQTEPFEILKQAQWIGWHLAIGLSVMGASLAWDRRLRGSSCIVCAVVISVGAGWLGWGTGRVTLKVQTMDRNQTSLMQTGRWIDRNLPRNAVILADSKSGYTPYVKIDIAQFNELAFYGDRVAYKVFRGFGEPEGMIKEFTEAGGEVYLLDDLDALPRDDSDLISVRVFASQAETIELRKIK